MDICPDAGHRTDEPHDCFVMNCAGLGDEVRRLRDEVIELRGYLAGFDEDWEEVSRPRPPIRVSGDVGTIEGPPIAGTDDRVNSGSAQGAAWQALQDAYEAES